MKVFKKVLLVLGILLILNGLLWIGQGLNIIKWPARSFMINVPVWSWRGLATALVGMGLVLFARRK